jgi:hypothetical protein
MEKQRRSSDPPAVMHLARLHWQANCRVTPQALLPALLEPQD